MIQMLKNHPELITKEDHMGANVMFYAAVNQSTPALEHLKLKLWVPIWEFDDK